MTEAMPFLQKAILLSYDPPPFAGESLLLCKRLFRQMEQSRVTGGGLALSYLASLMIF